MSPCQTQPRLTSPAPDSPDWAVAVGVGSGAFLASLCLVSYSGVSHSPDEWFFLSGDHDRVARVSGGW